MQVYLDNSATTQMSAAAADLVKKVSTIDYGNPSSLHRMGVEAERYVKTAALEIAKTLHCQEKEIIFTSGGTESNNLAIIGAAMANYRVGRHIITTDIEHPSVQNAVKHLEEEGFEVTRLGVNEYGEISLDELAGAIRDDTILISVMMINNEMGALEPVAEAGKLIHEKNPDILFHVDAVQAYGKCKITPKKMGIDLLSVSAHKIHGPKGVGFLYIRDKAKVRPILYGGGQQRDLRSGTINAPGIAGLGEAVRETCQDPEANAEKMYALKESFMQRLSALEGVRVNGRAGKESAPHIVSAVFSGVKSEVLLHALEEKEIYVSAGSACASGHPADSTTLPAIGLDASQQESTLRFSFSIYTTREELDYTADALAELLPVLRQYRRR